MKEIVKQKTTVPGENFIDKTIRYLNPEAGARRMHARVTMEAADTFYRGASRRRHGLKNWTPKIGDADQKAGTDLPFLRERSADLFANSPLATGAINTNCTNIIGSGLKLQPSIDRRVVSLSDEQAHDLESAIDIHWNTWSSSARDFDIAGTHTLNEMALIAFRSTLLNGDTFVNMPFLKRKGSLFGLKAQLIDAARVCNPEGKMDSLAMTAGVEKDGYGMPIFYHILNVHPARYDSKVGRKWKKHKIFGSKTGRRNILHLSPTKYIGQTRGVPYLSPVIETLKKLDEYAESELTAAVVSSLFTVFVKKENATGGSPLAPPGESGGGPDDIKMGSGSIVDLNQGETVEFADPKRPNTAFDPFTQAVLRQVGVALEIPFEILIKHFTSSYSAARASILEAWRYFMARRQWLAEGFYAPIYENWMEEMVANGIINAPGFFDSRIIRQAYLGANWKGPARGHIDEKKEIEAAEKRMALGISTASQETAEINGGNWKKNISQIKKENTLRQEAGLSIPSLKNSNNENKVEEPANEDN